MGECGRAGNLNPQTDTAPSPPIVEHEGSVMRKAERAAAGSSGALRLLANRCKVARVAQLSSGRLQRVAMLCYRQCWPNTDAAAVAPTAPSRRAPQAVAPIGLAGPPWLTAVAAAAAAADAASLRWGAMCPATGQVQMGRPGHVCARRRHVTPKHACCLGGPERSSASVGCCPGGKSSGKSGRKSAHREQWHTTCAVSSAAPGRSCWVHCLQWCSAAALLSMPRKRSLSSFPQCTPVRRAARPSRLCPSRTAARYAAGP